jgi:hypothetical protein
VEAGMTREQALVSAELRRLKRHAQTASEYLSSLNNSQITPVPLEVLSMLVDVVEMVDKVRDEYEKLLQRDH